MAQKKGASKSKQKAKGGGRTPNAEPRVQDFKGFLGCNFELSPSAFTYEDPSWEEDSAQTDLMMTQFAIQNNASIEGSGTVETRDDIVTAYEIDQQTWDHGDFTGAVLLHSNTLYAATYNGDIMKFTMTNGVLTNPTEVNIDYRGDLVHTDQDHPPVWKSINWVDDMLVALGSVYTRYTESGVLQYEYRDYIFVQDGVNTIANREEIPDPDALIFGDLTAVGVSISTTYDETKPNRVELGYTYGNLFGPTNLSGMLVFYSSVAVAEWDATHYVKIDKAMPSNVSGIEYVDVYFCVDNASDPSFAGRAEMYTQSAADRWRFSFMGYLSDTSQWSYVNLDAPTQNYTTGAPCTRMVQIDGRLYMYGSEDYPDRLYIGGNAGNLFSVSTGTGGGFVDVEPGTGKRVKVVAKYKTQSGNNIITLLCDSDNSQQEYRYNLVENTVSLSSDSTMKSWEAEHVAGSTGCKSFDGGLVCEDGIYTVSRYGVALTTLTMEYNSQIRTNYVSDPIKPAFTYEGGSHFESACLLEVDGILYLAFGADKETVKDLVFCYDIAKKAWWTYTIGVNESILKLFHVDSDLNREGVGIVCPERILYFPTTEPDDITVPGSYVQIETAELSTAVPLQGYQHLTQMRFFFDYFIGTLEITLVGVDQFGRRVITRKFVNYSTAQYNLTEFMRVDLRVQSYKIRFMGQARFRMTHFSAYLYVIPSRFGIAYGFDDGQGYREDMDIHPIFKNYNDIRRAMIT